MRHNVVIERASSYDMKQGYVLHKYFTHNNKIEQVSG